MKERERKVREKKKEKKTTCWKEYEENSLFSRQPEQPSGIASWIAY